MRGYYLLRLRNGAADKKIIIKVTVRTTRPVTIPGTNAINIQKAPVIMMEVTWMPAGITAISKMTTRIKKTGVMKKGMADVKIIMIIHANTTIDLNMIPMEAGTGVTECQDITGINCLSHAYLAKRLPH